MEGPYGRFLLERHDRKARQLETRLAALWGRRLRSRREAFEMR
ncbi:Uncharacterized protein ToN1_45200 [Aromatoleum petrolei]|nr:Uncharacterized protein ToN1_45200 [Aromatoleum petrolei]